MAGRSERHDGRCFRGYVEQGNRIFPLPRSLVRLELSVDRGHTFVTTTVARRIALEMLPYCVQARDFRQVEQIPVMARSHMPTGNLVTTQHLVSGM
jgi:hypothetical protein